MQALHTRRALGDLDDARHACDLGLSVTVEGSVEAVVCLRAFAEVEAATGESSSARQHLDQAIQVFRKASLAEELAKAEKALNDLKDE